MLALLTAQLVLVVPHDAAARGQLQKLERYADRTELVISLGGTGNAISPSARAAILRWPGLVTLEIVPPLSARDADSLRPLGRLSVRLPPRTDGKLEPAILRLRDALRDEPSLSLLGPSLIRVERAPSSTLMVGPCPQTDLRPLADGSTELRLEGDPGQCVLDDLSQRLEPRAEMPGDLPPEMQLAAPSKAKAKK